LLLSLFPPKDQSPLSPPFSFPETITIFPSPLHTLSGGEGRPRVWCLPPSFGPVTWQRYNLPLVSYVDQDGVFSLSRIPSRYRPSTWSRSSPSLLLATAGDHHPYFFFFFFFPLAAARSGLRTRTVCAASPLFFFPASTILQPAEQRRDPLLSPPAPIRFHSTEPFLFLSAVHLQVHRLRVCHRITIKDARPFPLLFFFFSFEPIVVSLSTLFFFSSPFSHGQLEVIIAEICPPLFFSPSRSGSPPLRC